MYWGAYNSLLLLKKWLHYILLCFFTFWICNLKDGWHNKSDMSKYNFIDLFSGAGGLSCGMVMAGFNPVASVEIMPQAVETYEYNFIEKKALMKKLKQEIFVKVMLSKNFMIQLKIRRLM